MPTRKTTAMAISSRQSKRKRNTKRTLEEVIHTGEALRIQRNITKRLTAIKVRNQHHRQEITRKTTT